MARPVLALEAAGQLFDRDPGLKALGVHLVGVRDEEEVDAALLRDAGVRLHVDGVGLQIGRRRRTGPG